MSKLSANEVSNALLKGADILSIDKRVVTPDLLKLLKDFLKELRGTPASRVAANRAIAAQQDIVQDINLDQIFNLIEGIIETEEKLLLPTKPGGVILADTLVKALQEVSQRRVLCALIARIL